MLRLDPIIKRLKGTQDILPAEANMWQSVERISRNLFSLYGYREIRTPIIEETRLFARSVGKETDIVKKQMYSFLDRGNRNISLRPEETASVVRAYIENRLDNTEGFVKLYYMGPMFRSERPQAGRFRQFSQIGVEAIGSCSTYLEAEIIILLNNLLKEFGLTEYRFNINSLGCEKDKSGIINILKKELKSKMNSLCEDCKAKYKTNILRILDCKHASCRKAAGAISVKGVLCRDCDEKFLSLQKILKSDNIEFTIMPTLVRGLDYYTGLVFEVSAPSLGAQDAIAAGGRYDNLVSDLGGGKQDAIGFAIGVERVIQILSSIKAAAVTSKGVSLFIATIGKEAYREGFDILSGLRREGITSDIDYQQKSLRAQMRYADKIRAEYVLILGEDELKDRKAVLKNMSDSSQVEINLNSIVEEIKSCKL
jgi:histidyl-tRNA synthetase